MFMKILLLLKGGALIYTELNVPGLFKVTDSKALIAANKLNSAVFLLDY